MKLNYLISFISLLRLCSLRVYCLIRQVSMLPNLELAEQKVIKHIL